jgi:hypothetical protein
VNLNRSAFFKWSAAGAVAVGALFAAASANAQVIWSVGISAPGVAIGVAEPSPVYYEPAPVYSRPALRPAGDVSTSVRPNIGA